MLAAGSMVAVLCYFISMEVDIDDDGLFLLF